MQLRFATCLLPLLGLVGLNPTAAQEVAPELFAPLRARSIGPAGMSGRVASIAVVESDTNTIYVGAGSGGLWKSTDAGLTFDPIFDDQPVASIGAIAIHQQHPETIWVGTGEANLRNSSCVGNGVYKSLDGGRTWEHLGLEATENIAKIRLHPTDPDVAYVAATGTAWGENHQRGVFRTEDGGETWDRVLYVNERTACADLVMDPQNPRKLFASMWEFRRWPWFAESGGPSSGLYVSRDGGESWDELGRDEGLPGGDLGRIGLAICREHPEVVYALVEAQSSVLLRSDDGGSFFRTVNSEPGIANRPFYYGQVRVDPQDPNRVYLPASTVRSSQDGGRTFQSLIPYWGVHPDHHAWWINPANPAHMIDGNDGGIAVTHDYGETWRFVRNLPLAQYYHIAVDNDVPYHIYGGMQDNGSWRGPSEVWENGGIRNHHWQEVGFGDGFNTLPHPDDSRIGYAMSQTGYLMRWNRITGERKSIRPADPEDGELRFNWNAGLAQDPFESDTIWFGSQYVHRSKDRGDTWELLSGDLTTNHAEWQKQGESGGLTLDVTGAENFCSILVIAPSPVERGVVWVGTDDGRVHVSRDEGATWTSLEERFPGLPPNTWCPHIEASKHDGATAYAVFDDHRRANWETYVYRTRDYGETWTSIASDDLRGYAHSFEEDPVDPNLLFLGTEFGLFVSLDGAATWMPWKNRVPTVSVRSLVIHPREHDLVLGTHGRAAIVIDDISPLRGISSQVLATPLRLLAPKPAIQRRSRQVDGSRFAADTEFIGTNAPAGATLDIFVHDPELPHPNADIERARKESERLRVKPTPEVDPEAEPEEGSGAAEEEDSLESEDSKSATTESTTGSTEEEDEDDELRIEILDSEGEVIRTLLRRPREGLNRIRWDLRRKAILPPPVDGSDDDMEDFPGARAVPGTYTVRVSYRDETTEASLEVLPDPRVPVDLAGWGANVAAQERVAHWNVRRTELDRQISALRSDLSGLDGRIDRARSRARRDGVEEDDLPHGELREAIEAMTETLDEIDERFSPNSNAQGIVRRVGISWKIGRVEGSLGSSNDAPNGTQLAMMEQLDRELSEVFEESNAAIAEKLEALRTALEASNLEPLGGFTPIETPRD